MTPTVQSIVVGFLVLLMLFRLIEMLRPRHERLRILRRGFSTDLVYWAFTPLVSRVVTRFCVVVALVPIAFALYGTVDRDTLLKGYGPLSKLPLWVQGLGILIVGDFAGY